MVARRAAGHVDGNLLSHLNDLCRARYEVGDHASAAGFLAVNTEFHPTIAKASGNSLLVDAMATILDKTERVNHMCYLLNDRNEDAFHEHHELVQALISGDDILAENVMREQISADRRFVVESMLASPIIQSVNVAG